MPTGGCQRGSVGIRNLVPWLGGAVGIGCGGIAQGRMVGFASCKPADALVCLFVQLLLSQQWKKIVASNFASLFNFYTG